MALPQVTEKASVAFNPPGMYPVAVAGAALQI